MKKIRIFSFVACLIAIFAFVAISEAGQSAKTIITNQAPVVGCKNVTGKKYKGTRAKVYYTKHIDSEHLIKLYNLINEEIYGKVAIKVHTGEKNGPNILPREMVKDFQAQVPNSSIVETNTLYKGDRFTTESHKETLKVNGWTFCPVDIMDEDDGDGDGEFEFPSILKNRNY